MTNASNEFNSFESAPLFMDIIYACALALHYYSENSDYYDVKDLNCIAVAIEYSVSQLSKIIDEHNSSSMNIVKSTHKKESNS